MGPPILSSTTKAPPVSAIQQLLESVSQTAPTSETDADQYGHRRRDLALQIAHNLRFQHSWSDLRLHAVTGSDGKTVFALLSGMPPQRLYVDPDEQIELLQQQQKKQNKTGLPDLMAEREWVLPSHLREKWTLRRFGAAFDAITLVPEPANGELLPLHADAKMTAPIPAEAPVSKWRTKKRLLLATLDDDSTVVYYIVHDGLQKPRQN